MTNQEISVPNQRSSIVRIDIGGMMAEPIMHHREPEFEKIFSEIREGLKYLFQTNYKF